MMWSSPYLLLLALIGISLPAGRAQLWGAEIVGKPTSFRFIQNFPARPTVEVYADQSFNAAQIKCTKQVQRNYCTILLRGIPREMNHSMGLVVKRARTRVTATVDFDLERKSNGSFVTVVSNAKKVLIENLTIRGINAFKLIGIHVLGGGIQLVVIRNCEIFNFNLTQSGHAIAVHGTKKQGVQQLQITSNYVHDMRTGSGEAIVVNGYVRRWTISDNRLALLNNIAINVAGGDGVFEPRRSDGERILPHPNDAAQLGYITNNEVRFMSIKDNAQYTRKTRWVGAIHVDGARQVALERNFVNDSDWGYGIGAQNCVTTRHIRMTNNTSKNNTFGDLAVGGFKRKGYKNFPRLGCNPLRPQTHGNGHGNVQFITIMNNIFKTRDGIETSVYPLYRSTFAVIKQDGVRAVRAKGDGTSRGDGNAIRNA